MAGTKQTSIAITAPVTLHAVGEGWALWSSGSGTSCTLDDLSAAIVEVLSAGAQTLEDLCETLHPHRDAVTDSFKAQVTAALAGLSEQRLVDFIYSKPQ